MTVTNFNMNAIDLLKQGLNVIPVKDKRPLIEWQRYQTEQVTEELLGNWRQQFPSCEWGIVTGPISSILVLDIDGEEGRKSIEALKVEMPHTWVTKTRRGWHYYFKWEESLKSAVTTKVGLLGGIDLRGNGGYVVAYNFSSGHSPSECSLASVPQWLRSIIYTPLEEKTYRPGWISEALDSIKPGDAGEGRTKTFSRLIGRLNSDGWAEEDIFALLKPHAETYDFDLKKLYDQIEDMTLRYADQSKAKEYAGKSASTLLKEKPPIINWCVSSILPKQGIGIIAGWPGIGKSWLLLDMAICVATGQPWLGKFEVQKGRVMYVDEDSHDDLIRVRLNKLLNAKELPTNVDVDFYIQEGLDLTNPTDYAALGKKIELRRPSLVIMDTLSQVQSEDENTTRGMSKVFKLVKKLAKDYSTAFLFADHPRRSNGMEGGAEERLRGAVTKAGALDSGFFLTKIGDNILVEQIKARYTQALKSFEVKVIDVASDSTGVRYIG